MSTLLLDIEGTPEELQEQLADYSGQRLRITVHKLEAPSEILRDSLPRKLSITEKILARAEAMPAEERAKMPQDLAEQHDHYIYGWPKK